MFLTGVILSKLIMKACHRLKNPLTNANLKLPRLKEKQCCYKNKAWKIA